MHMQWGMLSIIIIIVDPRRGCIQAIKGWVTDGLTYLPCINCYYREPDALGSLWGLYTTISCRGWAFGCLQRRFLRSVRLMFCGWLFGRGFRLVSSGCFLCIFIGFYRWLFRRFSLQVLVHICILDLPMRWFLVCLKALLLVFAIVLSSF